MIDVENVNKLIEGMELVFKKIDPTLPELLFAVSDVLCHFSLQAGIPEQDFLKILAKNYRDIKLSQEENKEVKNESTTTV